MKFFAKYGSGTTYIDITKYLYEHKVGNYLHIMKNDNYRCKVFGDPIFGVEKRIYVFSDEGHLFEIGKDEDCYIDIEDDLIYINELPCDYPTTLQMIHDKIGSENNEHYKIGHIDGMNVYLPVMNDILTPYRDSITTILECGSQDRNDNGNVQVKLFCEYFPNLEKYYGINNLTPNQTSLPKDFISTTTHFFDVADQEQPRMAIYKDFSEKGIKFDLITINATHNLSTILQRIDEGFKLLSDKGIMLVKDINNRSLFDPIKNGCNDKINQLISIWELNDIRTHVARTDNLLLINKNKFIDNK